MVLAGCALKVVALEAKVFGGDTGNGTSLTKEYHSDEDTLFLDSLSRHHQKKNYFCYNADVMLTEHHELHYGSEFYPIDSLSMRHNVSHSFVVDLKINDTTQVEMQKHCYALLSYQPLVIVEVFEVDFDGHTYVVHELYDERTQVNLKEQKSQPSRDCFQIQ